MKTIPEKLSKGIIGNADKIQENNPCAKVAYSVVFRRKDSHELKVKIRQVNKILSKEMPMHGFQITPNENILFSNLNNDSLHLNNKRVRKFVGSLIEFINYC